MMTNTFESPARAKVRQMLRDVRHAYLRTQVLCARAERYREMAMQATGRMEAVRVSGTTNHSKVETYVLELIEVHSELQKEIHALMKQSREAEKKIAALENDRHRAVLELRYLCACDWADIAERLHFSLRWVHKLHNEAIGALAGEGA